MGICESANLATPFSVPGNPETDVYLLPVSGGADSSALAIWLHEAAPQLNWRMVFTDTGAEEKETLEMLDKLEQYLGKKIERLMNKGLFNLIEDFSGFLPSPRDRWCTRELKLVPFRKWIAQFDGVPKWMFVGIRADESSRIAFTLPEVETVMPFVDHGITREWVYRKLGETVGIPRSYTTRSRSGCTVCPYARISEVVGLLQRAPAEFERGAQCEKLTERDATRHEEAVPLWKDTSIAVNWHSLPLPETEDEIEGRLKNARGADLFGRRIFVGGEFFMDGFPGFDEFVWHQRVVCYSTSLAGLKKQLDGRYQHLLSTGEVYGMTGQEVREKVRFAIWMVELPDGVFDPSAPSRESYTWHQNASYRQIRHVVQWVTRALQAEHLRRQAARKANPLSVQHEWAETAKDGLEKTTEPTGSVLLSQWYSASEKVREPEDEEEMLRMTPCPMCHL